MAKVRSRGNATTELKVVKLFRLHRITGWRRHLALPGRPDFAFPGSKLALFVDGCFWHGCPRCYTAPQSSKVFWAEKLRRNKARDSVANRQLRVRGWTVRRVWECGLDKPARFLGHVAKVTANKRKTKG